MQTTLDNSKVSVTASPSEERSARAMVFVGLIFIAINIVANFLKGATELAAMGQVSAVLIAVFSITHGYKRYGLKALLFCFFAVTVVSWSFETLSILTGFPFGNYHYTNALGPKLGRVPLLIMAAYFAVGYLCWVIGGVLLGKTDGKIRGAEVVLLPLTSAFVMVCWDVSMDPINSTIRKMWIWHDGGAYFGVPFVNFMGWFLCAFTFYVIFALYLRRTMTSPPDCFWTRPVFSVMPIIMYAQHVCEYLGGALLKENIQVTSDDGHAWWTGDIYATLTLVSLFTMLSISLYALIRVYRVRAYRAGQT